MHGSVLRWGQSAYESDLDLGLERAGAEVLGLSWRGVPESAQPPALEGVGALVVTSRVKVTAEVLASFPGSLVLTTTSGHDHIDVAAAKAAGIAVGRCPLARRDPVVEQALGHLIGLMRRQPALQAAATAGQWARSDLRALGPVMLRGTPVLVVGLGVIGMRMAEVLNALGAEVWAVDPACPQAPPGVRLVTLDAALPEVDAVSVHCALTPSSRNLFSAERLARMKPGAVLVNTARGAIVDVDAAVQAVREGRLAGIGLDVFPQEPWPGLHAASAVQGVWLTPHGAGYDRGLGRRVAEEVVATLTAWTQGAPLPHPVAAL